MIWTALAFIITAIAVFLVLAFVLSRLEPPRSWGPWPLVAALACALAFAYLLTFYRPIESVAPDYDQQGQHR